MRGSSIRRALLAAGLLVAPVAAAVPAGAQLPPAPEVRLTLFLAPSTGLYRDCDGVDHALQHGGGVLVERSGPVDDDLAVGLQLTGSLAGLVEDPPGTVVVPAGESTLAVSFGFGSAAGPGSIGVAIQPSGAYTVGDPGSLEQDLGAPDVEVDCAEDLAGRLPDASVLQQSVALGQQPRTLGLYDVLFLPRRGSRDLSAPTADTFDTPVVGELPPGLAYAEDAWSGAATAPGTYGAEVRLCGDPALFGAPTAQVCIGHVDLTVEVLEGGAAAPDPPGGSAPPADPVRAEARFTG